MNSKIKSEEMDRLFQAILTLQNEQECYAFFEDLCTVREIRDMSHRLEIACLLDQGMSYQQVAETTGVSSATISRVKRCLDYGSGGYAKAIERMDPDSGWISAGDLLEANA